MSTNNEVLPGEIPRKIVKKDRSELDQLKDHSLVVADTSDFTLI